MNDTVSPVPARNRFASLVDHDAGHPCARAHDQSNRARLTAGGRRLDQQAVERLGEGVVGVDLGLYQALPHQLGHRPEDRARIAGEGARLDQRYGHPATKVGALSKSQLAAFLDSNM